MKKYIAPIIIAVFCVIGFFVAQDALAVHYGKDASGICNAGGNFDCDVVNQSVYSQIMGVPFALLGMIGYALMLLFTVLLLWKWNSAARDVLFSGLCALASIGLGIQLYLTGVEYFLIGAWCLLCLISQVSILIVTITAWVWRAKSMSPEASHG